MFSAVNKLRLVKVSNFTKLGRAFATTNTTLTGSAASSKLASLGIDKVPTIHYNLVSFFVFVNVVPAHFYQQCNLFRHRVEL